jgi:uncharacterized membrane protein YoaK (UPF0700 family)
MALTVLSGAIGAISFLALGKVFTAFTSGNIVFLGLLVAGANGPDSVTALVSMAAFAQPTMRRLIIKPARPDHRSFQCW